MTTEIEKMIDDFIDEAFDRSPVVATMLGADGYDDRLDDLSAEAFKERDERADHWHARFSSIADDELNLEQSIDRDLILSSLKGQRVLRDWKSWKRDPTTYVGTALQGVFLLFLNRVRPEDELTDAAVARMKAAPSALDHARTNLDPALASPLFVKRGVGMCRAGAGYFRGLVPAEAQNAANRQRLSEAGEPAARAYDEFAEFLEKLGADATGEWAIGEETYSALLLEKEMLGYGARDMLERGRAAFADLAAEMSRQAQKMSGTDDYVAVLEELKADHPESHEQLREEFEEWTERSRQYLIDNDLVTMPEGEKCLVEPSPPFQRPILAVASYSAPPAFKPSKTGHFFVPFPPDGTPEEEVKKRLQSTRHGIPTTAVHEAYPGHHWHLVKMQENARRIRKVLRTSYFTEGWALYTEKMMREQGFFADPRQELCHLAARIFRAARIVVDTSLHIGEMTFDEALEYIKGLGIPEPTARAEVERYCSWPTQAPSYLTGSLEIERMRERYFDEGRGDLKAFHDEIATSGGLPIGLAERSLLR